MISGDDGSCGKMLTRQMGEESSCEIIDCVLKSYFPRFTRLGTVFVSLFRTSADVLIRERHEDLSLTTTTDDTLYISSLDARIS